MTISRIAGTGTTSNSGSISVSPTVNAADLILFATIANNTSNTGGFLSPPSGVTQIGADSNTGAQFYYAMPTASGTPTYTFTNSADNVIGIVYAQYRSTLGTCTIETKSIEGGGPASSYTLPAITADYSTDWYVLLNGSEIGNANMYISSISPTGLTEVTIVGAPNSGINSSEYVQIYDTNGAVAATGSQPTYALTYSASGVFYLGQIIITEATPTGSTVPLVMII